MYCKILRNTVLWTDFLASCREINRFSISKIGPKPTKPTISLALVYTKFQDSIVVVVLLFYVHGKHLRSCRDGQLT